MASNNRRVPPLKRNAKKSKKSREFWIVLSIWVFSLVFLVGITIYYYNTFVNLQQDIQNTRGQIESAFQMRGNLVPVLTSTVTNFVKHEDNVFMHTSDTRANAISLRPTEGLPEAAEGGKELLSKLPQELQEPISSAEEFGDALLRIP